YDLWRMSTNNPEWFRLMIRADQSNILSPDELEAMQEDMSPEEFDQELLCSFMAAIKGAYYAEQLRRMEAKDGFAISILNELCGCTPPGILAGPTQRQSGSFNVLGASVVASTTMKRLGPTLRIMPMCCRTSGGIGDGSMGITTSRTT